MYVDLFVILPNWKESSLSAGKWMKRLWYIHSMEYYSAVKRNELLIQVTTGMILKCIRTQRARLKAHTSSDSICTTFWEVQNDRDRNQIPSVGWDPRGSTPRGAA